MKGNQSQLVRHSSTAERQTNIQRIKSTLRSFPIISRNQTRILKRISLTENPASDCSSDIDNDEEANVSPFSIDHAELFAQKYELMEKLGEGSNGVVHRCVKRRTGQSYAVKSFMFDDEQLPQLKANFLLLRSLNHPNIVRYEALYIDLTKHAGWLVMELVVASSLGRAQLRGEEELRMVMGQVIDALGYLHRRAIAHRDIKADNILYDPESKAVKLIDFGICRKHRRRGIRFDMWTITGTLFYRAPEMFAGGGYTEKVDIWAAGVLLYRLIAGRTPFESEYHNQTIDSILHRQVEFTPEFNIYSDELRSLIGNMLVRDPTARPSASEILKHPWLKASPVKDRAAEEAEEEDWEGLSPTELPRASFRSYVREINGEEFHCIDSDEESTSSSVKKSKQKSISLHEVEFII